MWTRDSDQLLGQILPGGRQKPRSEGQEMQFPGIKLFFPVSLISPGCYGTMLPHIVLDQFV